MKFTKMLDYWDRVRDNIASLARLEETYPPTEAGFSLEPTVDIILNLAAFVFGVAATLLVLKMTDRL